MAKPVDVNAPLRKRRRSKMGKFRVDIEADGLHVQLDPKTIADALAAEAADHLRASMTRSTRRLKKQTRERRARKGVLGQKIWFVTGALLRGIGIGGNGTVISRSHALDGRQKGMALLDAGFRGGKKQITLRMIEERVIDRIVSEGDREMNANELHLATLIRRNKRGRI